MITALRKKHFQVWLVLAIIIPAGIISAALVVPKLQTDALLQSQSQSALPVVLKTLEKNDYTICLRSNKDSSLMQLEWINKKILPYATAAVYEAANAEMLNNNLQKFSPEENKFIGRVEAMGIYYFSINKNERNKYYFIVYDFIHAKIIDSVTL